MRLMDWLTLSSGTNASPDTHGDGAAFNRSGSARSARNSSPPHYDTDPKPAVPSLNDEPGCIKVVDTFRYARSRWQALTRYVTDGRLEMSNNAAERAMKPPVLGRKNYLFCGSDAGGKRAACIYTILETAKMCGINPQAYLADVLNRIADHPIRQIDTLLPWRWPK
jgi:transposase